MTMVERYMNAEETLSLRRARELHLRGNQSKKKAQEPPTRQAKKEVKNTQTQQDGPPPSTIGPYSTFCGLTS